MRTSIQIRQFLIGSGLWYPLNLLRSIPAIFRWLSSGCHGLAPHPVKLMVIGSYLKRYSIGAFVETGTNLGDTLGCLARKGILCTSIELSPELYQAARTVFKARNNVRLVQGDSSQKLPELLEDIKTPVLFWLDGHYSSGITASAKTHTPVSAELKAILNHPVKQHVILIDDARYFDGTNDYPHLDDLLRVIREDGCYRAEISTDIIRLVPRAVS
jgi:hypothetical protein